MRWLADLDAMVVFPDVGDADLGRPELEKTETSFAPQNTDSSWF